MRSFVIALLLTSSTACVLEDECLEERIEIEYTEPDRRGSVPADLYTHTAVERTGTLTWKGGAGLVDVDPSMGQTPVTIRLELDESSALSVEREKVGRGRLSCGDSIEMVGTLSIVTDDGALSESLELELESLGTPEVDGHADLIDYSFAGDFTWVSTSSTERLSIDVYFHDDEAGAVRGSISWLDSEVVSDEGETVTVAGAGRVLAEFEATL